MVVGTAIILVKVMLHFTEHTVSPGKLKKKWSTNTGHKDHVEKFEILSE